MAGLVGKFKLVSSENFGEFLKEIGVSIVTRKLAESTKPVVEISKDGDEYTIITRAFKTSEIKFKLGEEFDEKRLDGATVKTVINLEGDKLVQKQFGEKECVITREIEDGNLKVVCTSGAVISTRIYKPE